MAQIQPGLAIRAIGAQVFFAAAVFQPDFVARGAADDVFAVRRRVQMGRVGLVVHRVRHKRPVRVTSHKTDLHFLTINRRKRDAVIVARIDGGQPHRAAAATRWPLAFVLIEIIGNAHPAFGVEKRVLIFAGRSDARRDGAADARAGRIQRHAVLRGGGDGAKAVGVRLVARAAMLDADHHPAEFRFAEVRIGLEQPSRFHGQHVARAMRLHLRGVADFVVQAG
nr:hypothetical protein [Amantichitinum ursilacus]